MESRLWFGTQDEDEEEDANANGGRHEKKNTRSLQRTTTLTPLLLLCQPALSLLEEYNCLPQRDVAGRGELGVKGFPSVLVAAGLASQRGGSGEVSGGTGGQVAGDESRRTEAAQPRSEAGPSPQLPQPSWTLEQEPHKHPQFAQTAGS